jgi:hypothetical protein
MLATFVILGVDVESVRFAASLDRVGDLSRRTSAASIKEIIVSSPLAFHYLTASFKSMRLQKHTQID